ncbi:hypothetical protein [Marinivivus vitaminiproducens]|uniref:hypothetical protein n=1 Tax=Marinivivus vitaminiproducens TaxID=3035935 RepID=UPI00279E4DA6|nr:hypothetical protein P4R82_11975 [Geminicoccaceae bacterium SCSIO 64248]
MTEQSPDVIVALFDTQETFDGAIEELITAGVPSERLHLVAGEDHLKQRLGHRLPDAGTMAERTSDPDEAGKGQESQGTGKAGVIGGLTYIGAVGGLGLAMAAAGPAAAVATAVAAAAGGAASGGAIGALLTRSVEKRELDRYADQIRSGSLVLAVEAPDPQQVGTIETVLSKHDGQHMRIHDADTAAG